MRLATDSGKRGSRGFTLLEVIISLIFAAILGTILVSFLGTRVTQSANPVLMAQSGAYINTIMENMTADYKRLLSTDPNPMTNFIARVGPAGTTQTRYSAANHPYTIVENHRISFPATNPATETADANGRILKVTIQYRDLTLTALFTQ